MGETVCETHRWYSKVRFCMCVQIQVIMDILINFRTELRFARKSLFARGVLIVNDMFANVAIFLSLVTYVYFGNAFAARQAYVVTVYMNMVFNLAMFFWSLAIQLSAEALVSVRRVEEFLLLPESKADAEVLTPQRKSQTENGTAKEEQALMAPRIRSTSVRPHVSSEWGSDIALLKRRIVQTSLDKNQSPRLAFRDATAAWMRENKKGSDVGIVNVDLKVEVGKLCAVVGSVGSGKSSLLQVILGELDLDGGSVLVAGVVSYAAQEPWLFEGSVKQNIVFVEAWNEERFVHTIFCSGQCYMCFQIQIPRSDKSMCIGARFRVTSVWR